MDGWSNHPDYLTCGHIHKRQRIWNTDWARYSGSILPMSFAEKDYTHGVDLVTFEGRKASVNQLVYTPQHRLRILPEGDKELSPKKLEKLIETELQDRTDGKLDEHFDYVVLKVKMDSVSNDEISSLEELVNRKNAVLCKIQKVMPQSDLPTTADNTQLQSIDDILNRDPMDTLREAFYIINKTDMNEEQESMLKELLASIKNEEND
jgi:exonuclease SbcD